MGSKSLDAINENLIDASAAVRLKCEQLAIGKAWS